MCGGEFVSEVLVQEPTPTGRDASQFSPTPQASGYFVYGYHARACQACSSGNLSRVFGGLFRAALYAPSLRCSWVRDQEPLYSQLEASHGHRHFINRAMGDGVAPAPLARAVSVRSYIQLLYAGFYENLLLTRHLPFVEQVVRTQTDSGNFALLTVPVFRRSDSNLHILRCFGELCTWVGNSNYTLKDAFPSFGGNLDGAAGVPSFYPSESGNLDSCAGFGSFYPSESGNLDRCAGVPSI